jgi:FkbM family methyltransferase
MNVIFQKINYVFYIISKYTKIVEKRYKVSFHYFSIFRLIYLQLEKEYTKNLFKDLENYLIIGNYYLLEPKNKKNINIISGGIGKDITFDLNCLKRFDINKIVMIDPTQIAEDTTEQIVSDKVIFIKKALYSEVKNIKIYYPHESVSDNSNLSIENLYSSKNFTTVKTTTINEIKEKFLINQIDILKLDIEGVADSVIINLIENNIMPDQICFELEKPVDVFNQFHFFKRIKNFLKTFSEYYEIYNYTSIKKGYRMELLAIKK